jgi:hypothetical protein
VSFESLTIMSRRFELPLPFASSDWNPESRHRDPGTIDRLNDVRSSLRGPDTR